jgi:hypothetical protein
MRMLCCVVVLSACFMTATQAQAPRGDERDQADGQKAKLLYPIPGPSPAERMRCRVRRPALNGPSRKVCARLRHR